MCKVQSNIIVRLSSLFFLFLFLISAPVPRTALAQSGPLSGKKIVVNPGHGWYNKSGDNWDFQRSEYWGIREDLVNAEIAMYLVEDLKAMGADVYPTREMDKNAGNYNNDKPWWQVAARYYLKDRLTGIPSSVWDISSDGTDYTKDINSRPYYANSLNADLMISIHNNGCRSPIAKGSTLDDTTSCRGTETWYEKNMTKATESKILASLVQDRVINAIRGSLDSEWHTRGAKQAENRYGELLQADMPAALIEVAFHDRESPDNEMLHREDFKQIVAQAIADAIKDYFEANKTSVTDISTPDSYQCSQPGHVNFEGLPDIANLSTNTISGVRFTTTGGYTWIVSDTSTGKYNGKYPNGAYMTAGTNIGWLGPNQGSGRIDFPKGPASYFSLLVSNATSVYLDGYDASGKLLATAGPALSNINTGHMTELKITRLLADLSYVIVHDAGNYFIVDEVCTNAANASNTIKRLTDQTYPMQTGQTAAGNFSVESLVGLSTLLHIYVGPFGSNVDLILTRPDGSQVQISDPGVTFDKTSTFVEVFIENATPGQWEYQIVANELEPSGETIRITIDQEGFFKTQSPPELTVPGDQTAQYSDPFSFEVSATDPDDTSESLTFSATGLPNNLALTNNNDGTAAISGIVNVAPGTYTADITVTDPGGLSDTKPVTIEVVYSVPTLPVFDDFNRIDGTIGINWLGNKSRYRIYNNQLRLTYFGTATDIFWKNAFGADQEAYVTFTKISATTKEQSLLLKAQSNRTWGNGVIEVQYNPLLNTVQVWTWEWPKGWVKYGDDIPVTFVDGDVFGARARADGIVEIYRNGELIGTRDVTSWKFYDKGGYIGLWILGTRNTVLDDFGGGTVVFP